MYTATTQITINSFTPLNGTVGQSPCVDATLSPPLNTCPPPPGQSTPVFSGDGESIIVTVPANYTGSTQLTYQLFDTRYVLLGLAFETPGTAGGCAEFRSLEIERDTVSSQITVTDACLPDYVGVNFDYLILVQEVSTGLIGVIDPYIENEIEE